MRQYRKARRSTTGKGDAAGQACVLLLIPLPFSLCHCSLLPSSLLPTSPKHHTHARTHTHISITRYSYDSVSMEGVRVMEEHCRLEGHTSPGEAGAELRQRLRVHDQAHADAVLHMVASEVPGGDGRLLLSCGRDGVIKAWK